MGSVVSQEVGFSGAQGIAWVLYRDELSVDNVSFFNSDLLVKMAQHQINLTLPKTHMDSNVYFLVNSGSAA